MKVTSALFALASVFLSSVVAAPADVFDPPVISPNATTVWAAGDVETVTWYVGYSPSMLTTTV